MENFLASIRYNDWILHVLLALPILGAIAVFASPKAVAKRLALVVTIAELVLSLGLWWSVNTATGTMELLSPFAWIPQWGISYQVGIDGISMMMVLLTTLLMPLCVLGSFKGIT